MLRALLFDLDGTLADTDALHMPTWADALRSYDIEVDEDFYKRRISGRRNPDIVEDLLPHLSEEEGRNIADTKEADFRERAGELRSLPGLLDFIEEGRWRGLPIALVTNAPRENVGAILRGLGLEGRFDSTVLAEEVGVGKPDPKPYRAALERLSIRAEEAIAFEDSTSGIASAVEAGIPTVGVATTREPEKLREAGAFLVAEDFTNPEVWGLLDL
ncbi:MAG: HAD-IA family hydrolase [Actinomycetota bacterium]|nr:HAD-IA family hydrolase [Actinomycetota bacterium]